MNMVSFYHRSLLCTFVMLKYNRNKSTTNKEKDVHNDVMVEDLSNKSNKCRICLQKGNIPIFNENGESNIPIYIRSIAGLDVQFDDEYPKWLCKRCYDHLRGAILFIETAQNSNRVLKSQDKLLTTNETKKKLNSKFKTKDSSEFKKKIKCEICSIVVLKSNYEEHKVLHDPNYTKYICHVCGKRFRQTSAYLNHRYTHSTEFKFKCHHCPYKGKSPSLLKMHMKVHTKKYLYMCTECPARFLYKSNLNQHTFKHKIPTIQCTECKRKYHTIRLLRRHIDTSHLHLKIHICQICNKRFSYRQGLKAHERIIHKREKFTYKRIPGYLEAETAQANDIKYN